MFRLLLITVADILRLLPRRVQFEYGLPRVLVRLLLQKKLKFEFQTLSLVLQSCRLEHTTSKRP
jgi:hypothetical protein